MRTVGAVVRGIRTPIVREGDDLVTLVRDSVMAASETEHITFHDRDIVAVTESVVARAAGNHAPGQNIASRTRNSPATISASFSRASPGTALPSCCAASLPA